MKFEIYIQSEAFKQLDNDYKIMVISQWRKSEGHIHSVADYTNKHIKNMTTDSFMATQSASIY